MQSKHEALADGREARSADHLSLGSDVPTQWARVRARLREEFGEAAFRSWLRAMTLFEVVDGRVRIGVPTRFLRDWVAAHYSERIRALWSEENPAIAAVEILVGASSHGETKRAVDCDPLAAAPDRVAAPMTAPALARRPPIQATRVAVPDDKASAEPPIGEPVDDKSDISAPLDPRFTFENFVVGKPNELAHAAARRVAESCVAVQRTVPFNPLFLYGGVGLGKTHLMHAIAWHLRTQNPARKVIYLSAEKFMYQFIRALRFKDTMAFKEQFRSVDVLMIDDVQFISGKDSTQEEFFHTFNALVDQNRQIIISADKSPSDLEGMEERMRSRLGWGLVADIHPTTYELRLGILQAKAEQRKAAMPPKVLEFLAHKITSNVRELEGALNRILAHSQLIGRDITLESAQEVLHDLLRANDRRVTIDEIQKRVAEHYNIRLSDMHSARRARAVARPRQVAMFLCKQLTPRSLPEIGRKFGGRDHTTVMHAVKKIEELRATDLALAEDVELLRRMLET
ncbi:MAG: chromosomal replication initiator protein DnaA [Rhodospirillales bacterium]|nr:chromosomal replication initiator protein DnaA [Rhodospirillales bacterium]